MFGPIPLQRYCGNIHFLQLGIADHAAHHADQLATSGDAELGASIQRRLHGGAAACLAGGIRNFELFLKKNQNNLTLHNIALRFEIVL